MALDWISVNIETIETAHDAITAYFVMPDI